MRVLFLVCIFFCIGFFVHAQFFPDLLPDALTTEVKKTIGIQKDQIKKSPETNLFDQSTKQTTYKNGTFQPPKIITKIGNRVVIQNGDEKNLLWLDSTNQDLVTTRGYGYSEQYVVVFHEKGTFTATNKLNPQGKLTIEVR